MLTPQLITIIKKVRNTIEELNLQLNNPWGNNLCGFCGIASRFLIRAANHNGIRNMRLVYGYFENDYNTHCWVEYSGFAIDLTISQFSGFDKLKYRICKVGDEFYNAHYIPCVIGKEAISYQKQWRGGQAYSKHANMLWSMYNKG